MTTPRQPASPYIARSADGRSEGRALRRDDGAERSISSDALLAGRASITIDHQGMQYVLRATRAGKLILTK